MRVPFVLAAVATFAISGSALAQSSMTNGYTSSASMSDHSEMRNHAMTPDSRRRPRHALGSMRHPTVGNTANQRVNGG